MGTTVEARDQVKINVRAPVLFKTVSFFSKLSAMKGPFFKERGIRKFV
jgi:hypothetical protein